MILEPDVNSDTVIGSASNNEIMVVTSALMQTK